LLTTLGYRVEAFASAGSFLGSAALAKTDCLILDVCMPRMSGPDLQQELARRHHDIPIIFITAHGDEDAVTRVVGDGAVDCLLKPFGEEALLNAVGKALAR
jgi:FixJ family two-component response regulator